MTSARYPVVLTIAGSDSGGCAGIQADIKSISANGGFAASVITATTAQNTQGVLDIHPIPVAHIEKQIEAVLSDISVNAIKIGMLHSASVIDTVQRTLRRFGSFKLVLDPVMVATSGSKLIDDSAIAQLSGFLPDACLITPNLPEAEVLLGEKIDPQHIAQAAERLAKQFQTSVLLKGGHIQQEVIRDTLYLFEENRIVTFDHPFIATDNTHGTGCSLSSAIATHLSLGKDLVQAVDAGCQYIYHAIAAGKNKKLGQGHGPIDHFYGFQLKTFR